MSIHKLQVANVMGLDANNSQHGVLILEALDKVHDPKAFIEYLRTHKDGVEYANRVEKLDTLAYRYKNSDLNLSEKDRSILGVFCRELANKVKDAINILRDNPELDGELQALKTDGIQFFTNKEIDLMASLGSLRLIISLHESGELKDELYKKSILRTLLAQRQPSLGYKQNKKIDLKVNRF